MENSRDSVEVDVKKKKGRRGSPRTRIKEFRLMLGKEFTWRKVTRNDGTVDFTKDYSNRKSWRVEIFEGTNVGGAQVREEKLMNRRNNPVPGTTSYEEIHLCHIWV